VTSRRQVSWDAGLAISPVMAKSMTTDCRVRTVTYAAVLSFNHDPGWAEVGRLCPLPFLTTGMDREDVERQVTDLLRSYSRGLYNQSLKEQKRP